MIKLLDRSTGLSLLEQRKTTKYTTQNPIWPVTCSSASYPWEIDCRNNGLSKVNMRKTVLMHFCIDI